MPRDRPIGTCDFCGREREVKPFRDEHGEPHEFCAECVLLSADDLGPKEASMTSTARCIHAPADDPTAEFLCEDCDTAEDVRLCIESKHPIDPNPEQHAGPVHCTAHSVGHHCQTALYRRVVSGSKQGEFVKVESTATGDDVHDTHELGSGLHVDVDVDGLVLGVTVEEGARVLPAPVSITGHTCGVGDECSECEDDGEITPRELARAMFFGRLSDPNGDEAERAWMEASGDAGALDYGAAMVLQQLRSDREA